ASRRRARVAPAPGRRAVAQPGDRSRPRVVQPCALRPSLRVWLQVRDEHLLLGGFSVREQSLRLAQSELVLPFAARAQSVLPLLFSDRRELPSGGVLWRRGDAWALCLHVADAGRGGPGAHPAGRPAAAPRV